MIKSTFGAKSVFFSSGIELIAQSGLVYLTGSIKEKRKGRHLMEDPLQFQAHLNPGVITV